ncbi:uncharacterized protein LOC143470098 [Clavelina lepadiformis]|uniref:uncharacterized protein LOC143470098 n=1 Tax=Clavelina lepadiformis TaxID=159417 RepID=UPI00404389E7
MAATMKTMTHLAICFVFFTCLATALKFDRFKRRMENQYNCRDPRIQNKTECEMVMSHPTLQKSYKLLQEASEDELREAYQRSRSKRSTGDKNCPVMNAKYLNQHRNSNDDGARSLSPYRLTTKYDNDLIPSYYKEAECLCNGCIDPGTGEENADFRSTSLPRPVVFFRISNRQIVKKNLTVGCTCVIAINV